MLRNIHLYLRLPIFLNLAILCVLSVSLLSFNDWWCWMVSHVTIGHRYMYSVCMSLVWCASSNLLLIKLQWLSFFCCWAVGDHYVFGMEVFYLIQVQKHLLPVCSQLVSLLRQLLLCPSICHPKHGLLPLAGCLLPTHLQFPLLSMGLVSSSASQRVVFILVS